MGQPTPAPPPPQPEGAAFAGVLAVGGTSLVTLAAAHQARQVALSAQARGVFARLWRFLDPRHPQASWARLNGRAVALLTAAQREAARGADGYVSAALTLQGVTPDPVGLVPARAFAGTAADGRDLAGLLGYPAFQVEAFVSQGMTSEQASVIGARHLDRIVATEVSDAARVSTGVAVVGDRAARGYVRMLTPPSCSRCVVLAGRWYAVNAGFLRHPQCFPAGVVVSGPATLAATRRWYHGELVVLTSASGQNLALTGNHPVLTRRGWVPANLLNEGDEVVCSTRPDGVTPLLVPDQHEVPALIEDVWSSLGVVGSQIRGTAKDFHGDGQDGQVDVVYADGALGNGLDSTLDQQRGQSGLPGGSVFAADLAVQRMAMFFDLGHAPESRGPIRGGGLGLALRSGHLGSAHLAGGDWVAALDTSLGEAAFDDIAAHAVLAADSVFAGARKVGGHDLVGRQRFVAARWDAPGGPLTMENRGAHARRGADLLHRLAGQVELDRLVDVRRVEWSGHVYSLTSSEGWHSANSLIVSNCDCVHIPAAEHLQDVSTDPRQYFDSLTEAEQDAAFTKAGAQAIRDGSDIPRVVNARRKGAVYEAGGRLYTREATTRRGTGRRVRLMPEQIYREAAGNRDEAIRLLKVHGYIA